MPGRSRGQLPRRRRAHSPRYRFGSPTATHRNLLVHGLPKRRALRNVRRIPRTRRMQRLRTRPARARPLGWTPRHTATSTFLQDERFRREIQGAAGGRAALPHRTLHGRTHHLRYSRSSSRRCEARSSSRRGSPRPYRPEWKEWLARILEHVLPAMPFRTTIVPKTSATRGRGRIPEDPLVHHTITPRPTPGRSGKEIVRRRTDRIRAPAVSHRRRPTSTRERGTVRPYHRRGRDGVHSRTVPRTPLRTRSRAGPEDVRADADRAA